MYFITLGPCTDIENTITVVYIILHMFLVDYVIWLSVVSSTKPVPECLSSKFGKEKLSQFILQNRDECFNSYFLRHFWIANMHPSSNFKPYSPGRFRSPTDRVDEPIWRLMEKVLFHKIIHRLTFIQRIDWFYLSSGCWRRPHESVTIIGTAGSLGFPLWLRNWCYWTYIR